MIFIQSPTDNLEL